MTHFDWQQILAFGIVAVAAWAVFRRMAEQFAGFRKTSRPGGTGCSGCETGSSKKSMETQIITLSAAPPRRIVVPKPNDQS